MLTCNLCLEMLFFLSRHSDLDLPDAWGLSSKSDWSTGIIPPPPRFPPFVSGLSTVSSHPIRALIPI